MSDTPRPAPNFDCLARPYRWLEYLTLGPLLTRTRTHFLPRLSLSRDALVLGDGDGRFTARLLASNPHIRVHAVDTSAAMLAQLRRNVQPAAHPRLVTTLADALTILPSPGTDLIVTHFFLDCLTQPQLSALVARLRASLSPHTLWLISDFRIPAGPLHWPARIFIRLLYLAFRILTGLRTTSLPDFATPLRNAGFRRLAHHRLLFGLLTTELWQAPPED